MTTAVLAREAAALVGEAGVRAPSGASDIVDGVTPGIVVEPSTPQALAATLAWATGSGRTVVLRGSGTRDAWGRVPRAIDVLLRATRINRVIAHDDGDLTATIEAGARLADVNRVLAQRGQRLPLDPPHGAATTIGGVVAANDTGPLRHRYGTPRDLVIGMSFALADGTIAKSGGRVVKNVAGYDVGRLMAGSHGSLAAIIAVTFKLSPIAPTSRTVVVSGDGPEAVLRIVEELRAAQREPEALDLRMVRRATGPEATCALLVRYASVPAAVVDATAFTVALATRLGQNAQVTESDADEQLWREHEAAPWHHGDTVLRLSWRPAQLVEASDTLARVGRETGVAWIGRAAVGTGLVGLGGDTSMHAAVIDALRDSPAFDHVVVVESPRTVRSATDVWRVPAPRQALWQALKSACDPADTLNAGRGPL